MFSCNLLQISPLKLSFEKLRFFLNVFSECRKCYFRDPYLKNFLGGTCPSFNQANLCLRYSAHTFSDLILCWGRARKMGPLVTSYRKPPTISPGLIYFRKRFLMGLYKGGGLYTGGLYNKHTCREVSPGLDAPRVAGSFPNLPSEAR